MGSSRGSFIALGLGLSLFALAAGCNIITGSNGLEVGGGDSGTGSPSGSGPSGPGADGVTSANGTPAASGTGTGNPSGTGTGQTCPTCGANEHCEDSTLTCVCNPGFAEAGSGCSAVAPGDPSTRTKDEVCTRWTQDHQLTENSPFIPGSGDCDPGTLKQGGITDTLTRINLYRWLSGLGPVSDDPGLDQTDQLCANMESWWNFSMPESPHAPPASAKCYTAEGASGAGMSNIAWGNGPADSIDQFIEDNGNETTLGHRRWIVNPPLGPVGIGYWEGGGMYGSAECLAVFGSSGGGPSPSFVAVPNQGFVPVIEAGWTWSFHGADSAIANAQVTMLRVDDNTPLAVTMHSLSQGYGQTTVSWDPDGWTAEADKTYRVTVTGLSGGDVTYDVKPVSCP